ncbi:MAG: hypothetical protein INQ03_17285 [Candidatus Heimdallarchaeota archaeon]|nr:hypothetical protein [Candidatus Heimdallarchaeota archaeon]
MDESDRKYIKRMIAKYGYSQLVQQIEIIEDEMAKDVDTMFKFNIFDYQGQDYVFLDNIVLFLSKLEPFIFNLDVNELEIRTTQLNDENFVSLEQLLSLIRSLDPNVEAFNLIEIADYIEDQSKNR